jgi:hypothetical protein
MAATDFGKLGVFQKALAILHHFSAVGMGIYGYNNHEILLPKLNFFGTVLNLFNFVEILLISMGKILNIFMPA